MTDPFKILQAVKFAPRFLDEDMTAFPQNSDKAMLVQNFPKTAWTKLIRTQLVGKTQKVFAKLSVDSCLDYVLKTALSKHEFPNSIANGSVP